MCFEIYSDNQKKPRNMECGHTFCEQCLQLLHSSGVNQCPTCRRACTTQVKSLPINYVAADLARKYHDDKKYSVICEHHPKEICKFFCNTCSISICIECITCHCGHHFVKLDESVNYVKMKNLEAENVIKKIIEKNEAVKNEIEDTGLKFKATLDNELQKIDNEFQEIFVILNNRKEELKNKYRDMIVSEIQKALEDQTQKIFKIDSVLNEEEITVQKNFLLLQNLSDGSLELKKILNEVKSSKENVEVFDEESTTIIRPHLLSPVFEMPESDKKLLSTLGKISYTITENIYEPSICFFGDKNKVMAYKILENKWEMRQLDNRYEFNYYAASATLPNGSVLITGGGSSNSVYIYSDQKLYPACPMIQIRKEHAAVFISNSVYAIGGYDGVKNLFLNECEKYCIFSNKWTKCASMLVPRCAFSATSVNNKFIFIFGGYDGNQRLANIEKYNPELDTWTMINTLLKHQLSNSACFSPTDNKVIVLGGGFSSGFSNSVEMLDIESLAWIKVSQMNEGRDLRNKLTYYQGGVYCVGGYNFRAEVFHLVSNTWTQLPSYLVSDNLDSWSSALTYKIN